MTEHKFKIDQVVYFTRKNRGPDAPAGGPSAPETPSPGQKKPSVTRDD